MGTSGSFPKCRVPRHKCGHLPPSTGEVKNEYSCTSTAHTPSWTTVDLQKIKSSQIIPNQERKMKWPASRETHKGTWEINKKLQHKTWRKRQLTRPKLRLKNNNKIDVKKIKWARYRPGVAQSVGRGIALIFHDRGTRRVVSSTSRQHFTPGKDPVPILREAVKIDVIYHVRMWTEFNCRFKKKKMSWGTTSLSKTSPRAIGQVQCRLHTSNGD